MKAVANLMKRSQGISGPHLGTNQATSTFVRKGRARALTLALLAGAAAASPLFAAPILPFSKAHQPAATTAPRLLNFNPDAQPRPVQQAQPGVSLTAGQTYAPQSEVQRQLELLYQQNGRQAPNMTMPNTGQPQPTYQQPTYQQPTYQQPTYQQPVHQQPAYQQPNFQQGLPQQVMPQQVMPQQGMPQQNYGPPNYQQVFQAPPAPQPQMIQPIQPQPMSPQPRPQQLIQNPTYQPGAQQMQNAAFPQQRQQQQQAAQPKRGFLDRMFGGLRREAVPNSPPVDPGINYPKGTAAPGANSNMQRPAGMPPAAPPAVPPSVAGVQPGLLQPPSQTAAISDPLKNGFLPPGPDGESTVPLPVAAPQIKAEIVNTPIPAAQPALTATPVATAAPPAANVQVPAPEPFAAPQTAVAQQQTQTPASAAELVAPLAPSGKALGGFEFEDALDAAPAASAAATPQTLSPAAQPATVTLENRADAQPQQQPAAAVAATPSATTEAETPAEKPYQGLKLEEDMFAQAVPLAPLQAPSAETGAAPESVTASSPPAEAAQGPLDFDPFVTDDDEDVDMETAPEKAADEAVAAQQPAEQSTASTTLPGNTGLDASPSGLSAPTALPEFGVGSLATPSVESTAAAPLRPLPQSEPAQLAAPPTTASTEAKPSELSAPSPASSSASTQSKMEKIAQRDGAGLKGFCPVALRDHRDLIDASAEFSANYRGETYFFSSEEALEAFLNNPRPYVPANNGQDVVHHALTGEELTGVLDYAVWYKGRLYLFSSVETMETFQSAPSSHVAAAD